MVVAGEDLCAERAAQIGAVNQTLLHRLEVVEEVIFGLVEP